MAAMKSAIDPALLAQLAEDVLADDLRLIINTFIADMARLCPILGEAAAAGDGELFRRTAHGIAGAAGAVAAIELEASARRAMRDQSVDKFDLMAAADAAAALAKKACQDLTYYLANGALPP